MSWRISAELENSRYANSAQNDLQTSKRLEIVLGWVCWEDICGTGIGDFTMSINSIHTAGVPTGYETAKAAKSTSRKTEDFMHAAEKAEKTEAKDKAAEYAEKAFLSVGSKAPEEVKKAWMEAAKETGANGLGVGSNGMMTHISQMMVQRLKKNWLNGTGDSDDILGSSVSSAMRVAKQALYDLENPLVPENTRSMEVQRCRLQEKAFYQAFIEKLEKL